jgi:hypothetical protein
MNSLKASIQSRKILFKVTHLVMIILLCNLLSYGQTPGLTIGNVGVCGNTTVLVPLLGNNLTNIGAITLFINYDSQSLQYDTVESIDPQLSGMLAHALTNPSRVSLVWSKTSGASFPNTTLLKLKFTVLQKPSNISFVIANCELANISIPPQIISVNYSDGSIFSGDPTISSDPQDKTIFSQSNAVFQVVSPNASGFTWQEKRPAVGIWLPLSESSTYAGTQTSTLTIKKAPVSFNQFQYRCFLTKNPCSAVSGHAILSVDSVTGISGQLSRDILHLSIDPNPFSDNCTLNYVVPEYGFVSIKIFSMTGKIMGAPVEEYKIPGTYSFGLNFVYLPVGIYVSKYVFTSSERSYETSQKLIKTGQN